MTIVNVFDRPVIEVDKRDPDVSWANHLARKSLGGVDLAYPYGAEVKAPADGRFIYIVGNGSGGNIGIIYLNDGSRIEMMHLSAPAAKNASWVKAGQVIVKSGASGFGNDRHYAAHLHVHMVLADGTRVNLFHYFPKSASAAVDSTPITPETRHPMAYGVSTTNHGDKSYAVVDGGRWATIATETLANALSTNPNVGKFTELTVADFYELRDACAQPAATTVNNALDPAALAKLIAAVNALPVGIAAENARRVAS